MEVIAFIISISALLYVIIKNDSHKNANRKLHYYITLLEKRINELEQKVKGEKTAAKKETQQSVPQKIVLPVSEAPENTGHFGVRSEQTQTKPPEIVNIAEKYREKVNAVPGKTSEFWTTIEKQFVENWTGILGAVIMVIGVGFLGVYAALKLSAFNRFLLISAFAGALAGIFFYLKKQEKWIKFALWLRSSSGAIFLFACLGSGGIPGLQWIADPYYSLALLIAGILVNLYLGFAGGNQVFASLHVLLSLIALCIAPQSAVILIIAALVSLFGIALTYREKWDYHLLLTISSFFLFHLYWYYQQTGFSFHLKITGIITVLLVSLSVAFVHYRKVYRTKVFETLPFSVHLINWFYFGLGLFLHSTGAKLTTLFISLGAVGAFFLARRAKKMGIRWLYHTDTLVAQLAAVISIITLYRWHLDELTIIGAVFIEIMIFLYIMLKEDEPFLYKVGMVLLNITGITLLADGLTTMSHTDNTIMVSHSATLFACFSLGTIFHLYNFRKNKFDFGSIYRSLNIQLSPNVKTPVFGIILGLILTSVYLNIYKTEWSEYFIVLAASVFLYVRNRFQSVELAIASVIPLVGIHLINWLSYDQPASEVTMLVHYFPFLILSSLSVKWSFVEFFNKYINWIGIYLFAIHTVIISYIILTPVSPFLPAVVWLILSVAGLELSHYANRKFADEPAFKNQTDRFLLHAGYTLILFFLIRHIMVHLQSEQYIGFIKVRILIGLFAIGIFTYWATTRKPIDSGYRSWIHLHPLFAELIILFAILLISSEVLVFWQPILWIGSAFLLGITGNWKKESLSRLIFYSLVMSWVTAFQTSFITSTYVTPSTEWYDQAWLSGSIAIILQFAFLIYFYKKCSLENILLPKSLSFLKTPVEKISKDKNSWIFYPLVICTAIFLFFSFDKSILTLLWVIECFMVFIVSVLLKEKYFRYVALATLALCIARLIFYDLAQASTLTRALVFFGVGIIMLVMNSIYNKYKDRFINE